MVKQQASSAKGALGSQEAGRDLPRSQETRELDVYQGVKTRSLRVKPKGIKKGVTESASSLNSSLCQGPSRQGAEAVCQAKGHQEGRDSAIFEFVIVPRGRVVKEPRRCVKPRGIKKGVTGSAPFSSSSSLQGPSRQGA